MNQTIHRSSVLGDGVEMKAGGEKNGEGRVARPAATESPWELGKGKKLLRTVGPVPLPGLRAY